MTRYREQQNTLKPAVPTFYAYDEEGGDQIPTTGVNLTWDTVKIKTSEFEYTTDTDRVYMQSNTSGFYRITYRVIVGNSSVATNVIGAVVCINGEGMDASVSLESIPFQTAFITLTAVSVIYLKKGDYIQLNVWTEEGIVSTEEWGSMILIEFIPMRGWDNSAGGQEVYKGGVGR